ncbi:MAG: hypothetical protein HC933_17335 [Pleurocapsa sp. SU_196_0]|nr:hypothetical protein [Pleurocapsa sp. SU_196_0]
MRDTGARRRRKAHARLGQGCGVISRLQMARDGVPLLHITINATHLGMPTSTPADLFRLSSVFSLRQALETVLDDPTGSNSRQDKAATCTFTR